MSEATTIVRGSTSLSSAEAETVREVYEALAEFRSVDVLSPAATNREKHWKVVTKYIALQMEFPEIAEQVDAAEADYFAEAPLSLPGYETHVFELIVALRTFALSTSVEDFIGLNDDLRSSVLNLCCYSDQFNQEDGVWE